MIVLFPILTAFLDRLGGWKYKWARRYILPIVVFLIEPTISRFFFCALMAVIFSFNLDEIDRYDNPKGEIGWEEIFLYGLGLSFCLWTIGGWATLIIPLWWALGIYWSNIGILKHKLDWKWVEIIRGFLIGGVCVI